MPWSREDFAARFVPAAVGMIHLPPLPGSPCWDGDMGAVRAAALRDAAALCEGGFGAFMVENYHDVPFHPGTVPAATVAALTAVAAELRREFPERLLGINVLRNDVDAALAVAAATGAHFVRCNVHVGAAVTDQGMIEGRAWRTMRRRRELGLDVGVMADVSVKHARPLVGRPLDEEARDLRLRGLADAVIVTGPATGAGADPADVRTVRDALPDCPLLVGSGVTPRTVDEILPTADGVIIGSALQHDGVVSAERTAEFVAALARAQQRG